MATAIPTNLPGGASSLTDQTCEAVLAYLAGKSIAPTEPLYRPGGIHFKGVLEAVSAIFAGLCCILTAFLVLTHLTNWTVSQEQRQLVRVILILPVFALCSLFSVVYYGASGYLYAVPQLIEPFGIVALFYFYVSVVTPQSTVREEFYSNLERHPGMLRSSEERSTGSLRWFHLHWILVFQLLVSRFGSFVAWEVTVATHCALTKAYRHHTLIIKAVEFVQILIAVFAVINYERKMKQYFTNHRAAAKLFSFKLLILLMAVQDLIFGALTSDQIWHPTPRISYFDLAIGIPNLVKSIEVFIASVIFLWSYSPKWYRDLATEHPQQVRSAGKAILDVLNVWDIIMGAWFALKTLWPTNFGKKKVHTRSEGHVGMVRESSENTLQGDAGAKA